MTDQNAVEPWLRGTFAEVDAVTGAVLHALQLAGEDAVKWCAGLSDAEMNMRPHGIAPVAFHLRHIARSLDRLLSYAEGSQLATAQKAALMSEMNEGATNESVMTELRAGLKSAAARVRAFQPKDFNVPRGVGRAMLPTSVAGLLVHCADHTQRHIGQAITTAKVVFATRS